MPSTTHIMKLYKFRNWEKYNTEYNLKLKMSVLWGHMSYRLVNRYQHFGRVCTLRLQNSYKKVKFSWTTLKTESTCTTATLPPLFFGLILKKQAQCSCEMLVSVHQSTRRHIQQDDNFVTGVRRSHLPRFNVTKRNNRRLDNTVSCEWQFRSNFLSREFQVYVKAQCNTMRRGLHVKITRCLNQWQA